MAAWWLRNVPELTGGTFPKAGRQAAPLKLNASVQEPFRKSLLSVVVTSSWLQLAEKPALTPGPRGPDPRLSESDLMAADAAGWSMIYQPCPVPRSLEIAFDRMAVAVGDAIATAAPPRAVTAVSGRCTPSKSPFPSLSCSGDRHCRLSAQYPSASSQRRLSCIAVSRHRGRFRISPRKSAGRFRLLARNPFIHLLPPTFPIRPKAQHGVQNAMFIYIGRNGLEL